MIILESTTCIEFHVQIICDYIMELGPQAQTLVPIIRWKLLQITPIQHEFS